MSYTLSGDEQSAAENLGSLEGYLGDRGYQTSLVPMQGENVVRYDVGQGQGYAPANPNYAPQGAVYPQSGISQQQFNDAIAYAQQMEQTAQIAAQQAIAAEESQFLAQLDYQVDMGYITDAQRDVYIVLRRNEQLERSHQTLAQRMAEEADLQEEAEQMDAKTRVSFREAMAHGVNWFDRDVRSAILKAEDLDEMRVNLRVLQKYPGALLTPEMVRAAGSAQPQAQPAYQTGAQVAAGVYAAAPGRGSGAPPNQIQKRSGNLGGYIRAKGGYQNVAVE